MIRSNATPDVKLLPDGRLLLLRDWSFTAGGTSYTVPAGFKTDASSWPTLLHWIVDWRRIAKAGIAHDWLYKTGQLTRRQADTVWYDVAQKGEFAANWAQALIGWAGLRLGGWWAWRRHRKAEVA